MQYDRVDAGSSTAAVAVGTEDQAHLTRASKELLGLFSSVESEDSQPSGCRSCAVKSCHTSLSC